jgi:hypothetical protein
MGPYIAQLVSKNYNWKLGNSEILPDLMSRLYHSMSNWQTFLLDFLKKLESNFTVLNF